MVMLVSVKNMSFLFVGHVIWMNKKMSNVVKNYQIHAWYTNNENSNASDGHPIHPVVHWIVTAADDAGISA